MAPERPGAALVGTGPSDADRLLPWDSPRLSWLFGNASPPPLPVDERFDLALAFTRNTTVAARLGEIATQVTQWDPEPPAGQGHASLWLARPVGARGLDIDAVPPVPVPTGEEASEAHALARGLSPGFLAIHPGSGSPRKNWPAEGYAELLRRFSRERAWLLLEGPADAASAAPLRSVPGVVTLRDAPLRVVGALLSSAGTYVGNDSGVSHVAAAWGAPTIALFGPTDPAVWAPQGPEVEIVRSPSSDIAQISVDAVAAAVGRIRSAVPARPSD